MWKKKRAEDMGEIRPSDQALEKNEKNIRDAVSDLLSGINELKRMTSNGGQVER